MLNFCWSAALQLGSTKNDARTKHFANGTQNGHEPHSHLRGQGVKRNKIFLARKLGVYFSTNNLFSNELLGYVDLSDFYKIWPK